eukprot:XP_014059138.1 PREDICTED: uncharacterized protein LOC106607074 isoform X6 [Salmo salar]
MEQFRGGERGSALRGRSTHNQRIEWLWGTSGMESPTFTMTCSPSWTEQIIDINNETQTAFHTVNPAERRELRQNEKKREGLLSPAEKWSQLQKGTHHRERMEDTSLWDDPLPVRRDAGLWEDSFPLRSDTGHQDDQLPLCRGEV